MIRAQAGALLSKVAAAACEAELEGFEFASGIPGTLGGAVRMNAGAYGGEMKQVLQSASVLTPGGEILTLPVEEMGMGLPDQHCFQGKIMWFLEAVLSLKKGRQRGRFAPGWMSSARSAWRSSRWNTEAREAHSRGRRDIFAGKLIQDAGLRGFRVGNCPGV